MLGIGSGVGVLRHPDFTECRSACRITNRNSVESGRGVGQQNGTAKTYAAALKDMDFSENFVVMSHDDQYDTYALGNVDPLKPMSHSKSSSANCERFNRSLRTLFGVT